MAWKAGCTYKVPDSQCVRENARACSLRQTPLVEHGNETKSYEKDRIDEGVLRWRYPDGSGNLERGNRDL